MEAKKIISLEGILEEIIFTSKETHFTVGRLRCKNKHLITVVGTIVAKNKGERIKVSGIWTHHSKYGKQLQII